MEPFASFRDRTSHQPVYVILGVQGSGTNLLSRILELSFNCSLIEDGSVIFNAAAELADAPSESEVRRAYKRIRSRLFPSAFVRKTRRLIKSNTNFDGIDAEFDASGVASGAGLVRFVYGYGAFRHGTDVMAIKSDDLWERIDRIDAVLPNRRVVLLTRDFRDNVLSVASKDFGPIDLLHSARFVKDQIALYQREYARTQPHHRFQLRYEDLLESPETIARQMSVQFGLPLDPRFEARLGALNIRRSNTQKWRKLPAKRLSQLEAILSRELQTYGYDLACPASVSPGSADWVVATATDAVMRIGQKGRHIAKRLAR